MYRNTYPPNPMNYSNPYDYQDALEEWNNSPSEEEYNDYWAVMDDRDEE